MAQDYLDVVECGRLQTSDHPPNAATDSHDEHDACPDLILAQRDDLNGAALAVAADTLYVPGRRCLNEKSPAAFVCVPRFIEGPSTSDGAFDRCARRRRHRPGDRAAGDQCNLQRGGLLIDGNFDAARRVRRFVDTDYDAATGDTVERERAVILGRCARSAAEVVLIGVRRSKADLGTSDACARAVLEYAPA